MADLFGRYCYIDTPWIAGKKTRYRIIGSGVSSNAWCEVPVTGRTELIHHDNVEEVVFVVLDTLVSDDSIIRRFALKDVDVIPADVRPVVHGRWIVAEPRGPHAGFRWADQYGECSECHEILEWPYKMNFCPNCGSYNGGDADG